LIVLLAACGTSGQGSSSAEPSLDASVPGEPLVEASPSAGAPSGPLAARPTDSVEGAPLGYLEYLPPGYGDGEPRPLLVSLHGGGQGGDGSERTLDLVADLGIPPLIEAGDWPDDRPFVVLAPQYGTEAAAGDCDTGDDIAAFLDFAIGHYEVDPSRVYLTGISCGAIGIWDYLAGYGDEHVAAAVPIAGHAEWALEEAGCAPLAEVPVWAFHGDQDEVVPTVNIAGPMDQIRTCDGVDAVEMELTVFPDADHDAWSRTYDLTAGHDIYAWMLEHAND
jgi:predicted peptidase